MAKTNGKAGSDPRPEVTIDVGGREWSAVIDFRAIGQIERKAGPLAQLVTNTLDNAYGVTDTAIILAEAIKSAHPGELTPNPEELSRAILADGLAKFAAIRIAVLQPAFAGPETRTGEPIGEAS